MKKLAVSLFLLLGISPIIHSQQIIEVKKYDVYELSFAGEDYSINNHPTSKIDLKTVWKHESGSPEIIIYGYWDSDGHGGSSGNIFKVRFCPTKKGIWNLIDVKSNDEKLKGQKIGLKISCIESDHKGFWEVDIESAGQRWYKRSDGSHPYIIGNTLYSFLSEHIKDKPTGGNIKDDINGSSEYFNKNRFAITGDIFPHPTEKPFIDKKGNPTDNGDFAHNPNPKWFFERVDLAVKTCYENDAIADVILNGPDSENARSPLRAGGNNGDYKPFLKYIAARYGSYPNVWMCLSNEYNIRVPKFQPEYMAKVGATLKQYLPYNIPVSVHADQGNWSDKLNTEDNWNDHIIFQNKMKYMDIAADYNNLNYWIGNKKPVANDELAYQGDGDGWTEEDVIEALLGAFLGGGYGSTGYKHPITKMGHYFGGNFSAEEHTAADNLVWLRQIIDENVSFWKLEPAFVTDVSYKKGFPGTRTSIFYEIGHRFRAMESKKKDEFVLGTDKAIEKIHAFLPKGQWIIKYYDAINKEEKVVSENAEGEFIFSSPNSRAVLFHFKKK